VVAADGANIRQSPSMQAAVLAEVRRGATLKALAVRGNWAKVAHEKVVGWVSLRLVE
jgi:SH3-like domain-containing protein